MKLAWEYELPVAESPTGHDYEGPIHVTADRAFFATAAFEHPSDIRATDRKRRGSVVTVHAVGCKSGRADRIEFRAPSRLIPAKWAFAEYEDQLLLHCGHLLTIHPDPGIVDLGFSEPQPIKAATRPRLLFIDGKMIFADARRSRLLALDLPARRLNWELELKSSKPYGVGPPLRIGDEIVCYGRDALNFIDPARY